MRKSSPDSDRRFKSSICYRLRYLPLFYDDLQEIVTYITEHLSNPRAANHLLDDIEAAILERLPVCESYEPYTSSKERNLVYYRIYVRHYVIYYVVIDDGSSGRVMEVRRCLYYRRNRDAIL